MTWALRPTPSGRPAHPSQPTTLRKLGPGNGSGSGCTFLPLSVNSFSTINNAGAPSAGTSSTTDLNGANISPAAARINRPASKSNGNLNSSIAIDWTYLSPFLQGGLGVRRHPASADPTFLLGELWPLLT
jgi:hypothetical protein